MADEPTTECDCPIGSGEGAWREEHAPDCATQRIGPPFDSEPIIRRALLIASETRLIDLCYLLECTTREAERFKTLCREMYVTTGSRE